MSTFASQKCTIDGERLLGPDKAEKQQYRTIVPALQNPEFSLSKFLSNPADLFSMSLDTPLKKIPSKEDRLLVWLDTYFEKGSFDDRTLVILTPEIPA